jgi:membrane protease YdiL (CAAX protease family)
MINDENARSILLRQGIVGFVEETLFRGIILYALARVWGHTRRGLIAAVIVQAALFGLIHILQALGGSPTSSVLLVIVNGFLSGIWWGALVVGWGSVWPVVILHAASNAAVAIHGLTNPFIEPATTGYLRVTLFELPLVVLGIWILMQMPIQPDTQHQGVDVEEAVLA